MRAPNCATGPQQDNLHRSVAGMAGQSGIGVVSLTHQGNLPCVVECRDVAWAGAICRGEHWIMEISGRHLHAGIDGAVGIPVGAGTDGCGVGHRR